jgi:hypothetical protein
LGQKKVVHSTFFYFHTKFVLKNATLKSLVNLQFLKAPFRTFYSQLIIENFIASVIKRVIFLGTQLIVCCWSLHYLSKRIYTKKGEQYCSPSSIFSKEITAYLLSA